MVKTLKQLAIEERKAYFKKWRSENKDKVKKHNATYWEKRVAQRLKVTGEIIEKAEVLQ